MTDQKVVKMGSQGPLPIDPRGPYWGISLTGPFEGMVVEIHRPSESPVVENAAMTVSQHAEFIFNHFNTSLGICIG